MPGGSGTTNPHTWSNRMTSRPTQTRLRLVAIGAAAVLTGLLLGPGAASGSPDAQTVHATTVPAPGAGTDGMADIIRDFCRPGETIVDPFAGSGTTIVAAKQLGIGAFGCELNAKHANYANRRIAAASRIA